MIKIIFFGAPNVGFSSYPPNDVSLVSQYDSEPDISLNKECWYSTSSNSSRLVYILRGLKNRSKPNEIRAGSLLGVAILIQNKGIRTDRLDKIYDFLEKLFISLFEDDNLSLFEDSDPKLYKISSFTDRTAQFEQLIARVKTMFIEQFSDSFIDLKSKSKRVHIDLYPKHRSGDSNYEKDTMSDEDSELLDLDEVRLDLRNQKIQLRNIRKDFIKIKHQSKYIIYLASFATLLSVVSLIFILNLSRKFEVRNSGIYNEESKSFNSNGFNPLQLRNEGGKNKYYLTKGSLSRALELSREDIKSESDFYDILEEYVRKSTLLNNKDLTKESISSKLKEYNENDFSKLDSLIKTSPSSNTRDLIIDHLSECETRILIYIN
jgi:hypothetical protein